MYPETASRAHLRFAIISFALVATVAVGFSIIVRGLIASSERVSADSAIRGIVGQQVVGALQDQPDTAATADALQRQADATRQFVAGDVLAVRVWVGGSALFSRGATMPEAGERASYASFAAPDGTPVFASYLPANGYTVEVDTDARPIDRAVETLQMEVTSFTAVVAVLAYALTQFVFWISLRRWAGQHRRLEFMYTRGQEIRASLDPHEVVAQITHDATRLSKAQYGFLALFEPDTGDLVLRATYDAKSGREGQHQRAIEEWFLRRCVATNTTVTSTQPVTAYAQIFGDELRLEGQVSLLCVPLSLHERVVGALGVIRAVGTGRYSADETREVQELADQAVMAVEQALLFAKVRSYADELEMSYDTTLKVLMAALDTKDDATEGHCERVAKLTAHLARQMDVPEAALVDMERGALLHDVGKIGVPDAVLKKPKELNEGEWEAMRKHPLLAGVMVGKVGFLEGALPILLYHHERFDGGGYPFGLAGDKIPIDARIFSVVDSYDAMTSDRPYRNAMSHEDAMAEIAANSGTQFDPSAVDAFHLLMEEKPQLQARVAHAISDDHIDHDESFAHDREHPAA